MELLYAICKRASDSDETPFRAIFAAYKDVFAQQGLDDSHDDVVYRYVVRVGNSTKDDYLAGRAVDLVERLRSLLEAQDIRLVVPPDDGVEDITSAGDAPVARASRERQRNRRRVSFQDARLEETWLSEHSEPINPPPPPPAQSSLLSLPPRRRGNNASDRRARSTSSQRNLPLRHPAPKHFQHASPRSGYASEPDDHPDPTLLFEPSRTQLEQNAEAFLSTSSLHSARLVLHIWHETALQLKQARSQAYRIAEANDHRTLLKQAFDLWRVCLSEKRQDQRKADHYDRLSKRATRARNLFILTKSFTHWATSSSHETLKTRVAQHHMLKIVYFRRWRKFARENQLKARSLLSRKYLALWREKTARRLLWQEQAVVKYEEGLVRRCKARWFWQFCSRRVESWHESWVQRRALGGLRASLEETRTLMQQANDFHRRNVAKRALRTLCERLHQGQRDRLAAENFHDRAVESRGFQSLHVQTRLVPVARAMSLRVNVDLQRKALRVWGLHLSLSQQAAEVDRKRILQSAWTNWNDGLRCRALAQKTDERLLVENLYRWVLQERLRLFGRTVESKSMGRALAFWHERTQQGRNKLEYAEAVFKEGQQRRRLRYGMHALHVKMRRREDAGRAAIEMANTRALPKVLDAWKQRTDQSRQLAKWAQWGRFYCLCSSTLKVWREKTMESKLARRREAYAQVRARVKIRLVRRCFVQWRTKAMEIHSMDGEVERRAQARDALVGTRAFGSWREQTWRYVELHVQATSVDQQKLQASALFALLARHADFVGVDQQALSFRYDTDLALLSGALKRIQWATFTAARRAESAEALWLRNRDQHVRQMLRHWASQIAARRAAADSEDVDSGQRDDNGPESPSLRLASRAASRTALAASPPPTTPGYMHTPSRSRRAGRFRPLPTPAPFTPMAFESAYLATTPAPLPAAPQDEGQGEDVDQSFREDGSVMDALTPQVTPFARKLRASGYGSAAPASALRGSLFGRSTEGIGGGGGTGTGTGKSVRFAGGGSSRFGRHVQNS